MLIDFFFDHYRTTYRIDKRLRAETKSLLLRYHWPGNVRELKNLMENLVVSVPSLVIEPYHLPPHIQRLQSDGPTVRPLREQLNSMEREIVLAALRQHRTYRAAARALGMDHSTLVKKLKQWNVKP